MRIGSILAVLLIVLIGSGFLLSNNLHIQHDLNIAKQQLEQINGEKGALQEQLNVAKVQLAESGQKVEQLLSQIQSLQNQVRQLQEENKILKDQNAQLRQQNLQLHALVPLSAYLVAALSSPLSLAIFLPIIPISAVATYVLVRSRKQIDQRKKKGVRPTGGQRTIWVQLTEEEVNQVIKIRRGR